VALPVQPDADGILRTLAFEQLVLAGLPGVLETVPAFSTVLILGEPARWDPELIGAAMPGLLAAAMSGPLPSRPTARVELPACYDPEMAPDLIELSHHAGLSVEDVGQLHASGEYTVLATGFSPGFAYLGDLDERIAMPRRASPRAVVEVGSIGIADRRTAVYPSSGPGGWQLVGRVPPSLFSDAQERIARFEPGARVRFSPIDRRAFEAES
jgi:KipI family sensor histidine kinase inhibitor